MNKLLCPVCNGDVTSSPLKSWNYRNNEVKRYECQNCKSKFNVYSGPKTMFTIPKGKTR